MDIDMDIDGGDASCIHGIFHKLFDNQGGSSTTLNSLIIHKTIINI